MRIAMLGTRGIPAQYGGFETAVEEIGTRLAAAGHDVRVYCRNPGQTQRSYAGMHLVNLPAVRKKSLETISHTALSVGHALTRSRPDVALLFNAANSPVLPLLKTFAVPTAVHVDGLEWERAKWAGNGARYYKWAVQSAVKHADAVIADARAIADIVHERYGRDSVYLAYGAPIVEPSSQRLSALGLRPRGYHLVVARLEPENHVREIVTAYTRSSAQLPLLVVGSSPYAEEYQRQVRAAARADVRIRFLGAVWDQPLLDELYGNCASYVHGHSVGGTNPSLLRAMGAGAPVTAFDVSFNREVTAGHARYWSDLWQLEYALQSDEADAHSARGRGTLGQQHVATTYVWDQVADGYERLCHDLAARQG